MLAVSSVPPSSDRGGGCLVRSFPLSGRDAADLFVAIRHEPCPWLLETLGQPGPSFLGSRPRKVFVSEPGEFEPPPGSTVTRVGGDPLAAARTLLAESPARVIVPGLPFVGGLVGFFGYDTAHCFERLPCTTENDLCLPDWVLMETRYVVAVDTARGEAQIVVPVPRGGTEDEARRELACLYDKLASAPRRAKPVVTREGPITIPYTSTYTPEEYADMVLRVKGYIGAGDIIQANVSQRLAVRAKADAFALYEHLRAVNPSPFAFYFDFGGFQLASCSPERLLEVRGRCVQTRPIAGTRPRGVDACSDEALRAELLLSEKERAEHIMLVDLERNDLGRVCDYGTVRVSELMVIEAYSHVFHIVSNVVGRLREGRDALDAVAAAFPGGTITGCPKVRCMEIIDEVERTRRGPYTGSAGYIGYGGDMDLNIIIRTFVVRNGVAYAQVGGGVVADSCPEAEFDETLHKARALLRAAQVAEQG